NRRLCPAGGPFIILAWRRTRAKTLASQDGRGYGQDPGRDRRQHHRRGRRQDSDEAASKPWPKLRARPGRGGEPDPDEANPVEAAGKTWANPRAATRTRRRARSGRGYATQTRTRRRDAAAGRTGRRGRDEAGGQTRTRRRDEAAGQTRTRRGGPDPDQAARKPWPKLRASSARGRAPDPASRRPSPRPPLRQGRGQCHG